MEATVAAFQRQFSKHDHFRLGCGLCVLLQDQLLTRAQVRNGAIIFVRAYGCSQCPAYAGGKTCAHMRFVSPVPSCHVKNNTQRLVAFSLLQDMYKPDAATPACPNPSIQNPFLPVLLSAFEQAGAQQQQQQGQHPALFAERLFVAELLINPQGTREVR